VNHYTVPVRQSAAGTNLAFIAFGQRDYYTVWNREPAINRDNQVFMDVREQIHPCGSIGHVLRERQIGGVRRPGNPYSYVIHKPFS
jgi:hypothetical protein